MNVITKKEKQELLAWATEIAMSAAYLAGRDNQSGLSTITTRVAGGGENYVEVRIFGHHTRQTVMINFPAHLLKP